MKRNWLVALFSILLVIAIGACVILAKNSGGLLQAFPTTAPKPPAESKSFIGSWEMYKCDSSINSEGNKILYSETMPAEWQTYTELEISESAFNLSIYETHYSGSWSDVTGGNKCEPYGIPNGIFNVTRASSEGMELDAADVGWPVCFYYFAEKDEVIVVKDGGEGTDMTDYFYFKRL